MTTEQENGKNSPPEGDNPANSSTQKGRGFADERDPWEWKSKFHDDARKGINFEASVLVILFLIFVFLCGTAIGLSEWSISIPIKWLSGSKAGENICAACYKNHPVITVEMRLLAVYFCGCLGGITFSIKWLIHSVAKGLWHLDRRYWRLFVPMVGGVYACVVITLFNGGLLGNHSVDVKKSIDMTVALAFLVGYFSDGVSGLLTNVANAVFGTVSKK